MEEADAEDTAVACTVVATTNMAVATAANMVDNMAAAMTNTAAVVAAITAAIKEAMEADKAMEVLVMITMVPLTKTQVMVSTTNGTV